MKVMAEIEVIDLCLCEQRQLLLKPYQLYRFTVDMNCQKCVELALECQPLSMRRNNEAKCEE